jgi:hypothetical protein
MAVAMSAVLQEQQQQKQQQQQQQQQNQHVGFDQWCIRKFMFPAYYSNTDHNIHDTNI